MKALELNSFEINILDDLRDGDRMRLMVDSEEVEEAVGNLLKLGLIRMDRDDGALLDFLDDEYSGRVYIITNRGKRFIDNELLI